MQSLVVTVSINSLDQLSPGPGCLPDAQMPRCPAGNKATPNAQCHISGHLRQFQLRSIFRYERIIENLLFEMHHNLGGSGWILDSFCERFTTWLWGGELHEAHRSGSTQCKVGIVHYPAPPDTTEMLAEPWCKAQALSYVLVLPTGLKSIYEMRWVMS